MNLSELQVEIEGKLKPVHFNDLTHCMRVEKMALFLGKGAEIDQQVIKIAALLHDIGVIGGIQDHEVRSTEFAREILPNLDDININQKDLILDAIENHVVGKAPVSLEGKIFRDADLLDLIGSIGVTRQVMISHWNSQGYDFALNLIPRVLGNITPDKFYTGEARAIAEERLKTSQLILASLRKELEQGSQVEG